MWTVVLSLSSVVTLVLTLMFCLCWRKKTPKSDWLGLEGLVTQKSPDENVNHLPSANAETVPDGIVGTFTDYDAFRRSIAVSNPRRSLPDIPSEGILTVGGDVSVYERNGDNTSDLYATVEPYHNLHKDGNASNRVEGRPDLSQHSSLSQGDGNFSPYAHVRENPYDKVRKVEHPYAVVQSGSSQEQGGSTEVTPRTAPSRNLAVAHVTEPVPNTRSPGTSGQSATTSDIPAASAVAGGIAASQELPYMTPPIEQPNFSGDSQDSLKGYTSISVREPLANIRAQTKALRKNRGELDAHYSTVSDDSDEMYTTIQDPNNSVYTSGSETYAQIQPPESVHLSVAVEPNTSQHPDQTDVTSADVADKLYEPAPEPPSFDTLKYVTQKTHSRQASTSSSVGNIGSPKPEKRQANSPLPPPPLDNSDKVLTCRNLDDMYAKVHKSKKKDKDDTTAASTSNTSNIGIAQNAVPIIEDRPTPNCNSNEILHPEHSYETLRKSSRKSGCDPGYEQLKPKEEVDGYDALQGPPSIIGSEPAYEVLNPNNRSDALSEVDPNYEELRQRTPSVSESAGYSTIESGSANSSNQNSAMIDGYSVVNKQHKLNYSSDDWKSKTPSTADSDHTRDTSTDEPNYESMPSESLSDPNYSVLKSTSSESDPNYESMNHNDPNYESVKYLNLDEPPYEKLPDDNSSKLDLDSEIPGYEVINKKHPVDSGYENLEVAGASGSADAAEPNCDTKKTLVSDVIINDDSIVQV